MRKINALIGILLFVFTIKIHADNSTRELETTIIKGNKEVPNVLFIVPWQSTESSTKKEEQKLKLHSLFGDLFDPILPTNTTD